MSSVYILKLTILLFYLLSFNIFWVYLKREKEKETF